MSPLAVVVALLVCVALGYATVKGFSAQPTKASVNASMKFERGERLDAPLPGENAAGVEGQLPGDAEPSKIERPALPDPGTVAEPTRARELLKRPGVTAPALARGGGAPFLEGDGDGHLGDALTAVEVEVKYEGYIAREVERAHRLQEQAGFALSVPSGPTRSTAE